MLEADPLKVDPRVGDYFDRWVGEPGPPHTIEITAGGQQQSGPAGTPVGTAPAVLVKDINGQPVSAGLKVTFGVSVGRGKVVPAGGKPADVVEVPTNRGRATIGAWILGNKPGDNQLLAMADGISATFTATGT